MLADHGLGVAAAGWAEPALASWEDSVPEVLIGVDRSEEDPGAQLSVWSPGEIHRDDSHKDNGDDEHGSPSPEGTLYGGPVRTYRRTR